MINISILDLLRGYLDARYRPWSRSPQVIQDRPELKKSIETLPAPSVSMEQFMRRVDEMLKGVNT